MTAYDNARRVIDEITAVANAIAADSSVRFTITTVTARIDEGMHAVPEVSTVEGVGTDAAYAVIREQSNTAVDERRSIVFTITPMFPAFRADFADITAAVAA